VGNGVEIRGGLGRVRENQLTLKKGWKGTKGGLGCCPLTRPKEEGVTREVCKITLLRLILPEEAEEVPNLSSREGSHKGKTNGADPFAEIGGCRFFWTRGRFEMT